MHSISVSLNIDSYLAFKWPVVKMVLVLSFCGSNYHSGLVDINPVIHFSPRSLSHGQPPSRNHLDFISSLTDTGQMFEIDPSTAGLAENLSEWERDQVHLPELTGSQTVLVPTVVAQCFSFIAHSLSSAVPSAAAGSCVLWKRSRNLLCPICLT